MKIYLYKNLNSIVLHRWNYIENYSDFILKNKDKEVLVLDNVNFKFENNVYEITVTASRRAYQLAKINDPEIEANSGKVVSLAAKQLFNHDVTYKIVDDKNK